MRLFKEPICFEWDRGNKDKNLKKHDVTIEECEEVFFDPCKKIANTLVKAGRENRYLLIGRTKKDRILFIVFTMRKQKIRIVSARDINKKERKKYEK